MKRSTALSIKGCCKSGRILHIVTLLLAVPCFLFGQDGEFLTKGNDCYRRGEYAQAAKFYDTATTKGENPVFSWFNLGNALYQSGDAHKAISCYETAVANGPEFVRGWINLGVLYYELQDYGACIAALENALDLNDSDAMTLSLLAAAHKELEHYGTAATFLEKAIEADSSLYDAYFLLYNIAKVTGDNREAARWLSKYPEKGGRYYDVLFLSGELSLESGDTAAALAAFRKCVSVRPSRIQGHMALVRILNNMNAPFTALMEADNGLEKDSSSVELALLAGQIAFDNGYYEKSENYFRRAFSKGDANAVVGLGNLLAVYEKYGDSQGKQRIKAALDNDRE